jgi:hypothetical protein
MTYNCFPRKIYPAYFNELTLYPKVNPILMAADLPSLRLIRRLGGVCLFCEEELMHYNFGFCYQREIWVLYAYINYFSPAIHLAQAIQLNGADKVLVLRQGINDRGRIE